jgi:hypothetical protein
MPKYLQGERIFATDADVADLIPRRYSENKIARL